MNLAFTKMEGLGNDFILIDDREDALDASFGYTGLARKLCSRRFGIGADGIILILGCETADFRFRIFNQDGSEPQMCGNGMRCFARLVYEKNLTDKLRFTVDTLAGIIRPELMVDSDGSVSSVRVDMGEPILDPAAIPFFHPGPSAVNIPVSVAGTELSVTAVSMGNPHAVLFVDNVDTVPISTLGPALETHERFPEKTNVEFVQVIKKNELKMRVWERGVGETLACGTGACAAVVASRLANGTGTDVLVHLAGGDLSISWDPATGRIYKTGPARVVFEGWCQII